MLSGLHVSELMWSRRHGVWLPTPAQIYTRECEWDWDSTVKCRGADYRWVRTADHPSKFLVFVPQTSSRSPACQGIGDRAVWYWFFGGAGLKFWMIAAERFGSPLALARLASESTSETRSAIALQLQQLMVTSTAVLTGDDSIEVLDAKATGSAAVWSELRKEFKEALCFAMGTTPDVLVAGPNGSRASTNTRDGVRLESSKLDAKMVCAALSQIARWVVWWNLRRDDARGLPILRTVFDDAAPISAQTMATGKVRVNEARAADGLPALSDADGGNLFVPAPMSAPAPGGFSAAPARTAEYASAPSAGSAPAASPFPPSTPSAGGMPDLLSSRTPTSPTSSLSPTSPRRFARVPPSGGRTS
jgi:hypothetical protein